MGAERRGGAGVPAEGVGRRVWLAFSRRMRRVVVCVRCHGLACPLLTPVFYPTGPSTLVLPYSLSVFFFVSFVFFFSLFLHIAHLLPVEPQDLPCLAAGREVVLRNFLFFFFFFLF
jgi:hypothetical protein